MRKNFNRNCIDCRIKIKNWTGNNQKRCLPCYKKSLPSIEQRFYLHVNKTKECWNWTGYKNKPRPYGRFTIDGKDLIDSRASWMIHRGEIPYGKRVLHKCDNPSCVNPEHLWIGTQKDNVRDCAVKDRRYTKLKKIDVQWIRENKGKETPANMAIKFGVVRGTIYCILQAKRWVHLT